MGSTVNNISIINGMRYYYVTLILTLCIVVGCSKENEHVCLHFHLEYAYSDYYEQRDSQLLHGFYPRQYLFLYKCVNPTNNTLFLPVLSIPDSVSGREKFHLYYREKRISTSQHFYTKNETHLPDIKRGILHKDDTLYLDVLIDEFSLTAANVSREVDIKQFLDTLSIGYTLIPYENYEGATLVHSYCFNYNDDKPFFLYTNTERQPWEKPRFFRLKYNEKDLCNYPLL